MQLIPRIDEAFATKAAREWVELFRRHDLLIEVVQDYGELAADPQIAENGMLAILDHPAHGPLPIVAPGVNLSVTPGTIRTSGPEFGQHTGGGAHLGRDWRATRSGRNRAACLVRPDRVA
jgi:crotonobetainyl-CoA:carnitine CoA-transferase CaiB-like acyl-CoA transferase